MVTPLERPFREINILTVIMTIEPFFAPVLELPLGACVLLFGAIVEIAWDVSL